MIYEKSGFYSIDIVVKIKKESLWVSLIALIHDKILCDYVICAKLYTEGIIKFGWLEKVIMIMGYVYQNQRHVDYKFLKNQFLATIKVTLWEQFIMTYEQEITDSSIYFYTQFL